ncbi:MAG: hypothetical protein ACLRSW_06295 [Christensenellaceae bacterium]
MKREADSSAEQAAKRCDVRQGVLINLLSPDCLLFSGGLSARNVLIR